MHKYLMHNYLMHKSLIVLPSNLPKGRLEGNVIKNEMKEKIKNISEEPESYSR